MIGDAVIYDLGVLPPAPDATGLILVDGEMRQVEAADYDLLAITAAGARRQR